MSQENNTPPQEDLNQILQLRREKLDKLRALGINPYPYKFEKDTHIPDLLTDFDSKIETEEHTGPSFFHCRQVAYNPFDGKSCVLSCA